jgi:aspartate aminotransferase
MTRAAMCQGAAMPSALMAPPAATGVLRASGRNVIDREPDWPMPVREAKPADKAALEGGTGAGALGPHRAMAGKFRHQHRLDGRPDDTAAGNGVRRIILNALMATLFEGQEAILPLRHSASHLTKARLPGSGVASSPSHFLRISTGTSDATLTPAKAA